MGVGGCGTKGARHRVRHSRRSMPLACACMPCAATAACGWRCVCVRSGTRQRHPWGSCLWRMCAPQGAPCRRAAGGQWVRCARGSTQPRGGPRRAHAVLPCCPDSLARHDHRGWVASSWGSATQHGAGCGVQVCGGVGSRGSLEPGAMEQRALRMPSPARSVGNVRGGGAWPWAAHPREAMERVPSFLHGD